MRSNRKGENEMTDNATITPAEFALAANTDPKTARRFLRTLIPADARPGKGGRWAIDATLLDDLLARFAARGANATATITALPDAK
jgi:hypothetical protein